MGLGFRASGSNFRPGHSGCDSTGHLREDLGLGLRFVEPTWADFLWVMSCEIVITFSFSNASVNRHCASNCSSHIPHPKSSGCMVRGMMPNIKTRRWRT